MVVDIALQQVGNRLDDMIAKDTLGIFWRDHWCAMFVTWCLRMGGVTEDVVKCNAYCPTFINNNPDKYHTRSSGYVPKPGDVIFFDWGGDGTSDHVGLVRSADGSTVYTVEGNSGGNCPFGSTVRLKEYSLSYGGIMGYIAY